MRTAFRLIATIFFTLTAVILFILGVVGCASQPQDANANQSTIPWNRPQSWEGGGMLGGFNPGPQGSTGH